jgi:hypothetical protein
MLKRIKAHLNKSYNLVFWILFGPAMLWTVFGVFELYSKYFDNLTKEDHLQFILRFFFPISVGLLVTALERRQRKKRDQLVQKIQKYLEN